MDDQLVNDVSGWLMALSTLVAGKLNLDEIRLRLGSYVPLLVEEFPNSRYFTSESLRYVARHSKWFPSYGELCDLLASWWQESLPKYPALGGVWARESSEPYPVQMPPPEQPSRHFGKGGDVVAHPPIRTPEEQRRIILGEIL